MSTQLTINTQRSQGQRRKRNRGGRGAKKRNVVRTTVQRVQVRQGRRRPRRGIRGNKTARTASGIGATSFSQTKPKSITVQNEEFIAPVTVAGQPAFNVTTYHINPGQAATFPWLSLQAKQWEKYVFNTLEFYYKREVSEFNAAGSAGKLIMSADFDASDGPPTNKTQMEDTVPHADSMPCENVTLRLPRSQMHGSTTIAKYVRPAGLPGGADIKTYDVGNLHVATQGIPANAEIGELRVRYSVTFSVPVLDAQNQPSVNHSISEFRTPDGQAIVTETETIAALPDVVINGCQIANVAGVLTPPAGNYLVTINCYWVNVGEGLKKFEGFLKKNGVIESSGTLYEGPGLASLTMSSAQHFTTANGTDAFEVDVEGTWGDASLTNVFPSVIWQAV